MKHQYQDEDNDKIPAGVPKLKGVGFWEVVEVNSVRVRDLSRGMAHCVQRVSQQLSCHFIANIFGAPLRSLAKRTLKAAEGREKAKGADESARTTWREAKRATELCPAG